MEAKRYRLFFLLALGSIFGYCQNSQEGKVIGVKDGDTIEILVSKHPIVVRLAHVDCPELGKGQAYSRKAKEFVSELCFGKMVRLEGDGTTDRYGRSIGVIYLEDGRCLNKELVKNGLAWHYKKYSDDNSYADLEKEARRKRLNIFMDAHAIAPWEWRKQ